MRIYHEDRSLLRQEVDHYFVICYMYKYPKGINLEMGTVDDKVLFAFHLQETGLE